MNSYSLKTALGVAATYICNIVGNQEICNYVTDNFPGTAEVSDFPTSIDEDQSQYSVNEPLSQNEFYSIINARLTRLEKAKRSGLLFVGEPDYLFSEFLGRGLRCSEAVCLLVRGFQLEELLDKIKDRPTIEIPEILKFLSQKLGLLSIKEPGGRDDRWIDEKNPLKKVSEALEDPDVKQHLDELRQHISDQPDDQRRQQEATVYVPYATGFLIGKNYLMTNCHVFNDKNKEEISNFLAYFRYEKNTLGEPVKHIEYILDPEVCISDKLLDFTIVGVKPKADYQAAGLAFPEAGDNFGWCPMSADPTLIAPPIEQKRFKETAQEFPRSLPKSGLAGEPAFIIQHPGGGRKRIVIFNNSVREIYQKFLRYDTDISFGSSGAPIYNEKWQLIGLHHSTIAKLAINQEPEIHGNLGTRICSIVDFLENNKANQVAQDLMSNNRYIVKKGNSPVKGTIHLISGYKRPLPHDQGFSPEHTDQEVKLSRFLLERILEQSQLSLLIEDVSNIADSYEDCLSRLPTHKEYQVGDIAVDIRINFGSEIPEGSPRLTVYYSNAKPKLATFADMTLARLRNISSIKAGSIQPVDVKNNLAFEFLDSLDISALILQLDFGEQQPDEIKKLIGDPLTPTPTQTFPLYQPLADSLKTLVKVISPIGFLSEE